MDRDGYKSDLRAAHARLAALERENEELKADLAARQPAGPATAAESSAPLAALTLVGGLGAVAGAFRFGGPRAGMIVLVAIALVSLAVLIWRRMIYVVAPNELLVISGRRYRLGDRVVGHRLVRAGRTLAWPLLERVDRLDLTHHALSLHLDGVFTKDGERVTVALSAAVKITGDPSMAHHAVERFLGRSHEEIERVAAEVIEAQLRAVCAVLTKVELEEDRIALTEKLMQELEHDAGRMGLEIDSLTLQTIS